MLRAGTVLGGRYEIASRIGSGGMSDVYRAQDKKLNRYVAIKVLKSEFSSEQNFVSKFRMEAQNAARLSHPNIVSVYDVGEDRGVYYIVMELVDGITLKKYIERKKKLEIRESIEVAMQVARGLEAAHTQHIIHRDIKPQNIMISRDGKVKVTDFGIARASSSQTISSNTMGSVHYISPEQARGGYCDERSDIYSLGITLYEMLTGRVPFEGDSTVSVALLHIQGEMVPPRQYEPLIPVSLEKIILKCTQKKPELRYSSASELIADLKKSLTMPNGDFVKINHLVTDSPTVVFSEGDRDEINRARLGGDTASAAEDGTRSYEDPDAYDSDSENYSEDYGNGDYNNGGYGDRDYDDSGYDDRDYDDSDYDDRDYDDRDYHDRDYDDRGYDDRDRYRDDYPEEPAKSSSTGMEKLITGISIVIAILIVVVVAALAMRGCSGTGIIGTTSSQSESTGDQQVEMRNLIGLSEERAIAVLTGQGLGYQIEEGYSESVNKGEVYDQEYKQGEMLAVGTVVTLKVNTGTSQAAAGNIVIPADLKGMSETDARSLLQKEGLSVASATKSDYSDDVAEGLVMGTDPAIGTSVASGTTVTLVLSKGPENQSVKVPDITGLTETKAISTLESSGLKAGKVTYDSSDDVESGLVISQSVNPGDKVKEGTAVDFVISQGAATATVPNLLYSTLSEAKAALKSAGLELGSVTQEYSDSSTKGLVISQSVKKGSTVDSGTSVDIVIGLGEKETKASKKTETTTEEATDPIPESPMDEGDTDDGNASGQ